MPYAYPRKSKYAFRLGRSFSGFGLFATQEIPRGEFVLEYFGPLLSGEKADEKGGKYLFEVARDLVIDGTPRNNIARYMNHSCKPNCYAEIDGKRVFIYTKRKVHPGEELTCSYGKEYWDDIIKPVGCKCPACQPEEVSG